MIIAVPLRLYTLGDRSLWMDEAKQVSYYYSDSILELTKKAAYQSQPPLDYLIGRFLLKNFGFSETVVR